MANTITPTSRRIERIALVAAIGESVVANRGINQTINRFEQIAIRGYGQAHGIIRKHAREA